MLAAFPEDQLLLEDHLSEEAGPTPLEAVAVLGNQPFKHHSMSMPPQALPHFHLDAKKISAGPLWRNVLVLGEEEEEAWEEGGSIKARFPYRCFCTLTGRC
jgi:hypothetical protein